MTNDLPSAVEIYIGAPIEVRSEQQVLLKIVRALEAMSLAAHVFCNFHVGGRQVDFMVATARATLVIEVKTFAGPVRGRQNGQWRRLDAEGSRGLGNPYRQVLDAKNALRDAMRALSDDVVGYPNACIVVEPRLPPDSDVVVDDYKVTLINGDDIARVLNSPSQARRSYSQWRNMADNLALRKVPTIDAAWSSALLHAEDEVARYTRAFKELYQREADTLLSDTYEMNGSAIDTPTYVDYVVKARRSSLVFGPSGCGKSLLAARVALAWQDGGGISVLLAAKYFENDFRQLLDRDLGLLDTSSAALLNAARRLASPLLVVVDGYNEVPASQRLVLTRSLRAVARRYGATVLVTAQGNIERPDLLELAAVSVSEPSPSLKEQIAYASDGAPAGEVITSMLACISSGLEARLLGEVSTSLGATANGPMLFEAYIRRSLGDAANQGIALLSRVSAELTRRLSFSLSVMEFDRLASECNVPSEVYRRIIDSRILVRRGPRISFWHELFLTAFSAEAAVRDAQGSSDALLRSINDPRYADSRRFLIAAIDDDQLLDTVLKQVTQADLLEACNEGRCGRKAQLCLQRHLDHLWQRALEEVKHLKFEIIESASPHIALVDETLQAWTASDYARLEVLGHLFNDGLHVDRLMEGAACLDATLTRSATQLREIAEKHKMPLRSGLFEIAYGRQSSPVLLSRLFACLVSGLYRIGQRSTLSADHAIVDAWIKTTMPGQRYLLLSRAWSMSDAQALLPFVLPLFGEAWRYQPYHLRLQLIDFAQVISRYDVEDPLRDQLIVAMDGLLKEVNPLLAGMILDVLQQLGALVDEEAEHVDVVRGEIHDLLSLPPDDHANARARAVFDAQFDHPYSSAYIEAMQDLTADERKRLWMMACEGTEHAGLFLAGLIQELVATGDPAVARAMGKWVNMPDARSVMPQEALRVYIQAHVGLGALGVPLPAFQQEDLVSATQIALRVCGHLCYWLARRDLTQAATEAATEPLLHALLAEGAIAGAAGAVMVTEQALMDRWSAAGREDATRERVSLTRAFPQAVLTISRKTLNGSVVPTPYFGSFEARRGTEEVVIFAIGILEKYGDDTDLYCLRELSLKDAIGAHAIQAIKAIERRTESLSSESRDAHNGGGTWR